MERTMKLFKGLLLAVALVASSTVAYAGADYNQNLFSPDDRDTKALTQLIRDKEGKCLKEKIANFDIGGDTRLSYKKIVEKINGAKQRGSGSTTIPSPGNSKYAGGIAPTQLFAVDLHLLFDYRADGGYMSSKLGFENQGGVFSGSHGDIKLERALVGFNILEEGTERLYFELGREKMGNIFESTLQFDGVFDGILLGYNTSFEGAGDLFVHGGAFIINSNVSHFGWIGEVGMEHIMDTGLYAQYSLINWLKRGVTGDVTSKGPPTIAAVKNNRQYEFTVSQIVTGYDFNPEMLGIPSRIYGSWLINTAAKKSAATNSLKANTGWSFGLGVGGIEKANDWALDVNYQYLGAQAVPDFDVAGIGRGNVNKKNLYDGGKRGDANFKGWEVVGLFALTNNLNMKGKYQSSNAAKESIGGKVSFKQVELGLIYIF